MRFMVMVKVKGSDPYEAGALPSVRSEDILNRTFRRHSLHP